MPKLKGVSAGSWPAPVGLRDRLCSHRWRMCRYATAAGDLERAEFWRGEALAVESGRPCRLKAALVERGVWPPGVHGGTTLRLDERDFLTVEKG